MDLIDTLNHGPADQAAHQLTACNASRRWVEELLRHRPYAGADSLLEAADRAARELCWDDVREALDAHPRIGDRASGSSREARWSRGEQAAVATADAEVTEALREANAAYERRFGHVFLIRAAGRGPEEMLTELHRRLGNDEATERAETTAQLAEITRLRLARLLAS
ncbi:2-oxo-4-hydroxy-4-carboxy-5-ureidoimidazoline decarboxylase [Pseudonocardia sp. RS11V-5]|uniref:2-oxo-4-hydroxy-4-carboxy-5-ureidoimidazoline decarboxylase n=1 Tax=Pseudonocardia terrae TaxID=2905831 RepID=UPI001E6007AF|nr:2-oxo-4-hydroxy-4-carboxy-5-ureidoimidazoline decarboxylase [Pseudonocardia terrae]MCE3552784.1 2-oxo-4-hydroxy-4-carboxy-5-ureidoimidazoline decarboxylase [Pseudonocardia terrae]